MQAYTFKVQTADKDLFLTSEKGKMEGNLSGPSSPTSPNEEGKKRFLFVKFILNLGITSSINSNSYGRIWSSSNTQPGT